MSDVDSEPKGLASSDPQLPIGWSKQDGPIVRKPIYEKGEGTKMSSKSERLQQIAQKSCERVQSWSEWKQKELKQEITLQRLKWTK